ncbi:hypothetical protein C8A03DRAFT_46178 [Achaetomium macrosporum]|uniref:Pyridoxamine 5'-phosphate oxidase N-terminal domain-containing protein n=1 Tax=Achaetomium macrosporum TaxID=79813 RepID=A0AAN7H9S2_9PEZI|nr:hypothetical protein C8A03DRAFT_46178 [Achaetomium macrosporum]
MGKFYETIPENLAKWIPEQKMFWVATAPLSASGHVNVSPKGGQYFGLLDHTTFWYMDLTGSGIETISHLYEPGNGRITVMFTSFESTPRIVRLFGHGTVLERGTQAFAEFVKKHDVEVIPASRSIIIVKVHQVASSCGMSVPFYEFKSFRTALNEQFAKRVEKWARDNSGDSLEKYWALKNSFSVDGLPGVKIGYKTMEEEHITPIEKMVGPMAPKRYRNDRRFNIWHLILVAILSAVCTACSLRLVLAMSQRLT